MNTITKLNKATPKVGDIYELEEAVYLLCQYGEQYFLANLETGSTWNGVKRSIEECFGSQDFQLVNYPITLTPQIEAE